MKKFILFCLIFGQSVQALPTPEPDAITGFTPLQPGEHPRLLFRKSDLPELKKRAQTPEGQAILKRLKEVLGKDKSMPAVFNSHPPVNIGPKGPVELPVGAFTVFHPAGWGLLYQLTGDRTYADLAQQGLDKIFEGQVDRDERYSWKAPGAGFRISGMLQAVSLAYDLNYDAWPADYRKKVVDKIQNLQAATLKGKLYDLEKVASGGGYPPSSNHYGAYVGGAIAALAIHGDPGVDNTRMERIIEISKKSIQTLLTGGFGDYGWFGEGSGSDKTAMQPGIIGLFQAFKHSRGLDWAAGSTNARHIVLTRLLELTSDEIAVHRPGRGQYAYGTYYWHGGSRAKFKDHGAGWSSDGTFAIGFGALPTEYHAGMRWIYENYVEPDIAPSDRIYETRINPVHAVYAFVNWPIDIEPENPSVSWPLAIHDSLHGYVLARNGYKGPHDILFTGLSRVGPVGYHKNRATQDVIIWGNGYRINQGRFSHTDITNFKSAKDGSVTFQNGKVSWAVDFSGSSGLNGLIASNSSKQPSVTAPTKPEDMVADDELDLSGGWTDGKRYRIKMEGNKLTVDSFSKKKSTWKRTSEGTIDGRKIDMQFKKLKLEGELNANGDQIEWANGIIWTRIKKKTQWKYAEGDLLKTASVNVNGQTVSLIMFSPTGVFPQPTVEGNTIVIGEQNIQVSADSIQLKTFNSK